MDASKLLNNNHTTTLSHVGLHLLIQTLCYLIGGLCFFVGSMCYFPSINSYVLGGWLFTIGSAGFFVADGLEWWTNNRVGCFHHTNEHDIEKNPFNTEAHTVLLDKWQRIEKKTNTFLSFLGSTLYLVGSIMFIPVLHKMILGTNIFIYASAICFVAQCWKLLRAGKVNMESPNSKQCQCSNLSHNILGSTIDVLAGIGGGSYLIGSFFFLPDYNIHEEGVGTSAVFWFQFGASCYLLSGLIMSYSYLKQS